MSSSARLRYTEAEIRKGGQLMKYPVTKLQKFLRFPIGLYFNNFPYFRALPIAMAIWGGLWYKAKKALNTDANIRKFKEINDHRLHSRFDPIHE